MEHGQKVAVITGASQGIGAALVKAYRDRHYKVVATARSIMPSNDDNVLTVSGDIADRATAERTISQGMARFGRIDTLVNNAGIFISKPFTQYTAADYTAILGVNTAGFLPHDAARHRRNGEARQRPCRPDHYEPDRPREFRCALRARVADERGLNAATKSLAIEYAGRGIRVNAVSPGVIKSPMNPVEMHEALDALHPIGHMGEISDIVEAILYLEFGAIRDRRNTPCRWRPERGPLIRNRRDDTGLRNRRAQL